MFGAGARGRLRGRPFRVEQVIHYADEEVRDKLGQLTGGKRVAQTVTASVQPMRSKDAGELLKTELNGWRLFIYEQHAIKVNHVLLVGSQECIVREVQVWQNHSLIIAENLS